MKKTHVLDSPITGRQYHNLQFTHCFCAGRDVGRSAGLGTRLSAGMSTGLSAESRNVMRFFPVTPKNVNQILESIKM
jgi:hypothetical protein